MANVQAARKLIKMGEEFFPGMKVAWIVTNAHGNRQDVEPYVGKGKFPYKPDYRYYARRVAETLARITEVFSVNEDNLMSGKKQASLMSFEESKGKKEEKGKRKEKKPKTLFDFE